MPNARSGAKRHEHAPSGLWTRLFSALIRRLPGSAPPGNSGQNTVRSAGHDVGNPYPEWARTHQRLTSEERRSISRDIPKLEYRPLFSVVIPVVEPSSDKVLATLDSLLAQLYPKWEAILLTRHLPKNERTLSITRVSSDPRIRALELADHSSGAARNLALDSLSGAYFAFIDPGDRLSEQALFAVAVEIDSSPGAAMIYTDDDVGEETAQSAEPSFKPAWSPQLLCSTNYLDGLTLVETSVARRLRYRTRFESCADYDLFLRVGETVAGERIRHLPWVLYHRRLDTQKGRAMRSEAERFAVLDHLSRQGRAAIVGEGPGSRSLEYSLPSPAPRASVIIPTRDRIDLLRPCVESLLRETDYPDFEIIVVDNDSQEEDTLGYLTSLNEHPKVRVLPFPAPYNFSRINNYAVDHAKGELLVFLNNDVEVSNGNWLAHLAGYASLPDVGAVGPMLLYPDGRIQHGGIILGSGGVAALRHRGRRVSDPCLDVYAHSTREQSAVTAACMAIRRDVFRQAGGFDEGRLPVAFNDVDLCLRLRQLGYRILWTPWVRAIHHESESLNRHDRLGRKKEFRREVQVMRDRWGLTLDSDPFYNPNLSLEPRLQYELAETPRVERVRRPGASGSAIR